MSMKRMYHYMNSYFDIAEYYEHTSSVILDPAVLEYEKDTT